MIVSSPAPLSANSVIRVWRLSCQRPETFAFLRVFFQAVFREVTWRVGSEGIGLPNGNRNHSSCKVPNRSRYHSLWFTNASCSSEFRGIIRPSPASLLALPTCRVLAFRLTWPQDNVL